MNEEGLAIARKHKEKNRELYRAMGRAERGESDEKSQ